MSLGLYVLPVGGTDPQQPHTEDEAYLVLRGRARIRAEPEWAPGRPPHPGGGECQDRRAVTSSPPLRRRKSRARNRP